MEHVAGSRNSLRRLRGSRSCSWTVVGEILSLTRYVDRVDSMARKKVPHDASHWVRDEPQKRISAKQAAEEIAALEGKTSEEMGEVFQGTMAEYERYLICREQALMELSADATTEEIEDLISDFEAVYDLVYDDAPEWVTAEPEIDEQHELEIGEIDKQKIRESMRRGQPKIIRDSLNLEQPKTVKRCQPRKSGRDR